MHDIYCSGQELPEETQGINIYTVSSLGGFVLKPFQRKCYMASSYVHAHRQDTYNPYVQALQLQLLGTTATVILSFA